MTVGFSRAQLLNTLTKLCQEHNLTLGAAGHAGLICLRYDSHEGYKAELIIGVRKYRTAWKNTPREAFQLIVPLIKNAIAERKKFSYLSVNNYFNLEV
jgi:hypothetical protein